MHFRNERVDLHEAVEVVVHRESLLRPGHDLVALGREDEGHGGGGHAKGPQGGRMEEALPPQDHDGESGKEISEIGEVVREGSPTSHLTTAPWCGPAVQLKAPEHEPYVAPAWNREC